MSYDMQCLLMFVWLLLPACKFRGEFAEQVRSGPAAGIGRQGSGVMAEGGRCGRRSISGRYAVTELTPMESAPDGGSTGQPTALAWGRGGGGSRSHNTEGGGRGGGQAVGQRAEDRHKHMLLEKEHYTILFYVVYYSGRVCASMYLLSLPFCSSECRSVLERSVHTYVFLRVIVLPGILFYSRDGKQNFINMPLAPELPQSKI